MILVMYCTAQMLDATQEKVMICSKQITTANNSCGMKSTLFCGFLCWGSEQTRAFISLEYLLDRTLSDGYSCTLPETTL